MEDAAGIAIETLTVRRQFLHCAQGRKASGRFVLLQARERAEHKADSSAVSAVNLVRFGLTASKKVGNAVVRNRARRRLREAMKQLLPTYGKPGIDYVAVARTATTEAKWPQLLDDLKSLFIRLSRPSVSAKPNSDTNISSGQPNLPAHSDHAQKD